MGSDDQGFRNPKSAFEIQRKVYCIIGDERVFNSKSPDMFTCVFQQVGLKGVYVPFMTAPGRIGEAIHSLRVLNIAGANVTVPYKEAVIPHLDILSEGAKIIGAINTVVWDGKILKGYNTNAIGFMDTLEELGCEVAGKRALVFGSGGAAKAVVFILNWLRAESVTITGRNAAKCREMAERLGGAWRPLESVLERPFRADIVVNATSISSEDESADFAAQVARLQLEGCEVLIDLNYGRRENFWAAKAQSNGTRFVDGLSTLAFQARRTFALWTGVQLDPGEFLRALEHP